MLIFQENIIEQICSHAQNEYPRECCGIMLGKRQDEKKVIHKIIQTRNMIEDGRDTTQFFIDPYEFVKVEVLAEEEGLEIVGYYHSHPDCQAIASDTDILHMIEGYSYLIISVRNGVCVDVNGFEKIRQTDMDIREEILIKERENAGSSICISNIKVFCKPKGKDSDRRNDGSGNIEPFAGGISGKQEWLV